VFMKVKPVRILIVCLAAMELLSGCSSVRQSRKTDSELIPAKPTFVFVHGAFQNAASTWGAVSASLEKKGFNHLAVDLPARDCAASELQTTNLDSYVNAVQKVVEAQSGSVILVGHSFGGITVSQVAEKVSATSKDKIIASVYLAAYLPQNGESLRTLTKEDKESLLGQKGTLSVSEDKRCVSIADSQKAHLFATGMSGDEQTKVVASVLSEPTVPMGGAVQLTATNFGEVPKYYIHTKRDVVLSYNFQKVMAAKYKIAESFEIDSGHGPYASHVQEVVSILGQIAQQDIGVALK